MKNYYYKEEGVEVVPNAWSSELSTDLLGLIAENILSLSLSEFIRFGYVCLDWRSFSIKNYQHIKLPNQVPVLLIPLPFPHHQKKISLCDDDDDDDDDEEGVEELKAAEEEKVQEPELSESPKSEEEGEAEHKPAEEEKEPEPELPEESEETETETESEESESEPEEVVMDTPQNYYNPKEIWQGQDHKQRYRSARNFYSLTEKMVYHDFPLPVPYYKHIRGSSHGWLVTVEEYWSNDNGTREPYLTVRLFNPFRTDNNMINLPPLVNGYPGNDVIREVTRTHMKHNIDAHFTVSGVKFRNL